MMDGTTPLGDRLRARRAELGRSQEQAAVDLGTTGVTLGRWENGIDYPRRTSWIPKLALWLGQAREEVALLIAASIPPDADDALSSRASGRYLTAAA